MPSLRVVGGAGQPHVAQLVQIRGRDGQAVVHIHLVRQLLTTAAVVVVAVGVAFLVVVGLLGQQAVIVWNREIRREVHALLALGAIHEKPRDGLAGQEGVGLRNLEKKSTKTHN